MISRLDPKKTDTKIRGDRWRSAKGPPMAKSMYFVIPSKKEVLFFVEVTKFITFS